MNQRRAASGPAEASVLARFAGFRRDDQETRSTHGKGSLGRIADKMILLKLTGYFYRVHLAEQLSG